MRNPPVTERACECCGFTRGVVSGKCEACRTPGGCARCDLRRQRAGQEQFGRTVFAEGRDPDGRW